MYRGIAEKSHTQEFQMDRRCACVASDTSFIEGNNSDKILYFSNVKFIKITQDDGNREQVHHQVLLKSMEKQHNIILYDLDL